VGVDPAVKTAFTCAVGQRGWRPLVLDSPADRDMDLVLQDALRVLGFGTPPAPPSQPPEPARPRLMGRFGRPISVCAALPVTIGREDEVAEIVACLRRREPCMPLIVGAPGSGKTNLLYGVASRLAELDAGSLVEINLLDVFSVATDVGRVRCLTELLAEVAESHAIVVIEHAELIAGDVHWGQLLLSRALGEGARVIGTVLPQACEAFSCPALARRIKVVQLEELSWESLIRIVSNAGTAYPMEIHPTAIVACVKAARDLPGHFPGKALSLLDAAASFVAVNGAKVVAADDIYSAAQRFRPLSQPQQEGG
jgi:ATP-dependent Clp protease ATP-binding subunit ClpA